METHAQDGLRHALDAGHNAEALDLARRAVAEGADAPEMRYAAALACARMGAITEADAWLARIDRERLADGAFAGEVWSLAGRIAKERYAIARGRGTRDADGFARMAIASYRRAFAINGAAYPAVNAATLALLTGDAPLSRTLAEQALAAPATSNDHWRCASIGEALLALGRGDEARAHYRDAHRAAGDRYGDIASMRRQLRLIGTPAALALLAAVPAPRIVAFSGHMIDHTERALARFPPDLEPQVDAAIRERLAAIGPAIGFAQAACGSDILFLEALQQSGMQTHVVLPCAKADFITASVGFAGPQWVARFERVLANATRVVLATEEPFLGDDILFEHAANLIDGMALLRARELAAEPMILTVHEPGSTELLGGTAATARAWRERGNEVENIDLASLRGRTVRELRESDAPASPRSATPRSLQTLLFADVSGFSRMPEQYTPQFVAIFLGACKRVLDALPNPAVDANTRGDGLFVVFDAPDHAAEFALRLQDAMAALDWSAIGLPRETGVRIGLHTGPVFKTFDPVMGKATYYGTHVNRAARLEPVVQPAHIFATEAFAASLIAEDDEHYVCHYIGTMPLAKHFGDARLYRLVKADG